MGEISVAVHSNYPDHTNIRVHAMRTFRFLALSLVFSLLAVSPVFAQQDTGNANGQTGNQNGSLNLNQGLSADEAFSGGVQRDGAVGSTPDQPVGANQANQNAGGGRATGGAGGGLGGGFGAAFGNLFGNTRGGATNSATPSIRTRIRNAVAGPVVSPQMVSGSVNSHMRATGTLLPVPAASPYGGVNVRMQGRTAILQGNVGSNRDRRMSELLMRLEPGVSSVENRLSVR